MATTTICLDPGHYAGYNRGAYNMYYEGNQMFKLAYMLKEELEKYEGIKVIVTRKTVAEDPSLANRAIMAKNAGAKCFLSLHSDAFNDDSINRVSVYRSLAMPNSETLGLQLMSAIVKLISKDIYITASTAIKTRDNGYGGDYYGVLRNSTGGSVTESFIVEHGFHTNYKQSQWLYDENNLRELAKVEAEVLAKYYGHSLKGTSTKTECTTTNTTNKKPTVNVTTTNKPTANTSSTAKKYINYTAKKGDTWWGIARTELRNALKYKELAEFNNKKPTSTIYVGNIIKIPVDLMKVKYTMYTIKKGDTWWGIAKREMGNGSRYKELAEFNGMTTTSMLKVGQTLKVPE